MPSTSEPATPIPVPTSLTSTTPNGLPPQTSQALIYHLRTTGAVPELSTLLADSLARTGWTDRVRALALELLRNGSCDTFPELMTEVLRRAKIPKEKESKAGAKAAAAAAANGGSSTPTNAAAAAGGINGNGAIALSKEWSGGPDGLPDVRIPQETVEAGVEFVKEKIKEVVEPVDDDSD